MIRTLTLTTLLAFTACDCSNSGLVDTPDTEAPCDTGCPGQGRGDLLITWSLHTLDGQLSCAEAGAEEVRVDHDYQSGWVRDETFPCDDQPILLEGLQDGEWTVTLSTPEPEVEGIWFLSEPTTVYVTRQEEVPLTVELHCQEKNLDDGCGGAR